MSSRGAFTTKFYKASDHGDMCLDVYEHAYYTCVTPIMDYTYEL